MPKTYSISERKEIIAKLHHFAFLSMLEKGIKKTTVDDLVQKVNIPKGTFYLFYNSKEMLLYEVLMAKEEELHKKMADIFNTIDENITPDELANIFYDFYVMGFNIGILPLMTNGELELLIRKIPIELVNISMKKDNDFILILRRLFCNMTDNDLKIYSSALRAIFFTGMHTREIGNFKEVLKKLLRGLVLEMWETK